MRKHLLEIRVSGARPTDSKMSSREPRPAIRSRSSHISQCSCIYHGNQMRENGVSPGFLCTHQSKSTTPTSWRQYQNGYQNGYLSVIYTTKADTYPQWQHTRSRRSHDQHAVADPEPVRRIDEDVARPRTGGDNGLRCLRGLKSLRCYCFLRNRSSDGFECADGRRADAEDATAALLARVDRLGRLGRHGERLEVHLVILDVVRLDGTERAGSDMQRDGDAREITQGDLISNRRLQVSRRRTSRGEKPTGNQTEEQDDDQTHDDTLHCVTAQESPGPPSGPGWPRSSNSP